jgi:hypothetical protein
MNIHKKCTYDTCKKIASPRCEYAAYVVHVLSWCNYQGNRLRTLSGRRSQAAHCPAERRDFQSLVVNLNQKFA